MGRVTFRWCHFLVVDAKAAEDYFNQMAQRGWQFRGSFLGIARFDRTDGPPLSHWVEPFQRKDGQDGEDYRREQAGYRALCADAGWDFVEEKDGLRIFRAQPGRDPTPLQTDPRLDFETNWTKVLRDQQWRALFVGAFWVFDFLILRRGLIFSWQAFLSPALLVCGLLLTLFLLAFLSYGFYLGHRRRRCRRALDRGEDLPRPGVRGARLRGLSPLVTVAACLLIIPLLVHTPSTRYQKIQGEQLAGLDALPIVRAQDVGAVVTTGLFREESSPWMSRVSVILIGSTMLVTERYEAAAPLVELVAQGLLDLEGVPYSENSHLHGSLTMVPADLGFDAAWVGQGDGFQVLVFREGTVVACVEGPMDMKDPAVLALIRTRLRVPQ